MNSNSKNILEFKNITKTFLSGTIIANNNISLSIERGEIHSLIGENGSGKSTLMSILFGLYKQDSGQIFYNGNYVDMYVPGAAKKYKIGMVHQHFHLVGEFSVLDNIILGQEKTVSNKFGIINYSKAKKHFEELINKYKITLDPERKVRTLNVGQRQKVELLKVLWEEKEVIILDEPTATLSVDEIQALKETIKALKKEGKTIIFISHKMAEVKELSDRISVLRKGVLVSTQKNTDSLTPIDIAKEMIGQIVKLEFPKREVKGKNILEVKDLSYVTSKGFKALDNVSFEVKEGEIFGLAGIQGNGQEEIIEIISGLKKATSGIVKFKGKDITHDNVAHKMKYMSHVPTDRSKHGIVPNMDLSFNSILTTYSSEEFMKYGLFNKSLLIDTSKIKDWTDLIIDSLDVEGAHSHSIPMRNLSGGNQQKFVIGRELKRPHELLLAGHPTRGLDIKAIKNIYTQMIQSVTEDKAKRSILLYSLELHELMAVCDRLAIIYKGKIVGIINPRQTTDLKVSKMMVGVK